MRGWGVERELRGAAAPGSNGEGDRGGVVSVDGVLEFQLQLFFESCFSRRRLRSGDGLCTM